MFVTAVSTGWFARSVVIALGAAIYCQPVLAQNTPESRKALNIVYGSYQSVVSNKEACNAVFPAQQAVNDKAFAAWQARHKALIVELDGYFTELIRRASADEKDYSRNVGKAEGALLQQRQEVKDALAAKPRAEREQLCKGLPKFLAGADSDLEKAYAEELRIIRGR
jgi:hypothetical protein